MQIEIIYIETDESYVISHPSEARDNFDKHLAELCLEHDDAVCMGKFIARRLQTSKPAL